MEKIYAGIADMIFERGACKFGAFKLKLHEEFPDAPLSPIYFNLRTADNPKPGPLTSADCDLIARGLRKAIIDNGVTGDAIASIPYAADPIVAAYERLLISEGENPRLVKLAKETLADKRRIIPKAGFEYRPDESVILFDDLITKADSKMEAIRAVESGGAKVKYVVVYMDRMQGGKFQLEKAGYKLVACVTVVELLTYYFEKKRISKEKYMECLNYIGNN